MPRHYPQATEHPTRATSPLERPAMPAEVIVYGSNHCPACTQAKAVLDRYQLDYQTRPISALPASLGRAMTMPQITIDGELLGGLNPLLKLARHGGLERLVHRQTEPWIRITRRIGRGYDITLLDALGRTRTTSRARSRAEAQRVATTLSARQQP
jgi:glutaredoxin